MCSQQASPVCQGRSSPEPPSSHISKNWVQLCLLACVPHLPQLSAQGLRPAPFLCCLKDVASTHWPWQKLRVQPSVPSLLSSASIVLIKTCSYFTFQMSLTPISFFPSSLSLSWFTPLSSAAGVTS